METGIAHIDALLEKRRSFHFTSENTIELRDTLESLLPIENYDLLSIKGFEVWLLKDCKVSANVD